MSRIPDYDKMRHMIAKKVEEKLVGADIYDMLMHGHIGYVRESDSDILELFITWFDVKNIPKKPLTKDEMNRMALENEDKRIERGDDNPLSIHMFNDQMIEDD